jgi:preprotein translocase subunit SecE
VAVASRQNEPQAPRRVVPAQRSGPVAFVRSVVEEMSKVVWPTPQELYRYLVVVVFTVVVIAAFIGLADAGATAAVTHWVYNKAGTK